MPANLRSRGRPAGRSLVLALGFLFAGGMAVAEARPAEGGANARTHRLPRPAARVLHCRVCARQCCTVVAVLGHCTTERAIAALKQRMKRRSRRQGGLRHPEIDDCQHERLVEEARGRIPRHSPEWSDHNESDPGMTILDAYRRTPRSVRIRPVPPRRSMIPEVDDEVMIPFEHGDAEKDDDRHKAEKGEDGK